MHCCALKSAKLQCKSGTLSCVSIFAGQHEHWDEDDDHVDPVDAGNNDYVDVGDDDICGMKKLAYF